LRHAPCAMRRARRAMIRRTKKFSPADIFCLTLDRVVCILPSMTGSVEPGPIANRKGDYEYEASETVLGSRARMGICGQFLRSRRARSARGRQRMAWRTETAAGNRCLARIGIRIRI